MKYLYIILIILFTNTLFAQKAGKVFKNFEKKDYIKAEEQFLKILEKDTANCAANFGLAYIYSIEESQKTDYFKAWDHFRVAYRNQDKLDADDAEAIKLHIATIDSRRRSRPLSKNFDIEKEIIQDKLITYVREENNLDVALNFIQEYPTSDYIENVYHIRNYIEFRRAEDANTLASYNLFLQKYPEAAQVETVIKLRNKKAFEEAKAKNTFAAVQEFIDKYPKAEQVFEAENIRNKLAFVEAKNSNNLEKIEAYIAKYPNATEVAEAMKIKRQLLFDQAKSINTLEAYNNFVKLYPEGKQFVDIFNLKANVIGNEIKQNNQIIIDNVLYSKGFDRNRKDDILKDVYMLNDRIYLVGQTLIEENNWDAWVIALDNEGKMIWNKSFGQGFKDGIKCIQVASNGNIYLGGIMNAVSDSIKGVSWLVKMTQEGQIKWSKTLKGAKIKSIAIDNNEIIYAGGSIRDSLGYKCQLFKLNNTGETLWTRNYLAQGEIESVKLFNENEVLFSGSNWISVISSDGYIKYESIIEDVNSFLITDVKDQTIYYAGVQDSLKLQYGAIKENAVIWNKTIEFENLTLLQTYSLGYASLHAVLMDDSSIYLYDFDLEGTELTKKTINKSTFTNRVVYSNYNGKNVFAGTANTFGQKDMYVLKFQ